MAYAITQACCADASCVSVCPVDCIHPTPDEPGFGTTEMLYVDAGVCIDCGACADACPVDAIKPIDLLRGGEEVFAQLNADYYADNYGDNYAGASGSQQTPSTFEDAGYASDRTLRVAIIGTGPAASYAARFLLTSTDAHVSMIDRLPVAGGLVRAGVAPDHTDTKRFGEQFSWVYSHPRTTMFMNVEVGSQISHDDVLAHHDAVIYAVGAHRDRKLEIDGEDLAGVYAAPDIVGWYNADPDISPDSVHIGEGRAVIIGNGNVALDIARILLSDPTRLESTDMADHALAELRRSDIHEVVLLARRGPEHAAFTRPELLMMPEGIELAVAEDPQTSATLDNAKPASKAALLAGLPRIPWPQGIAEQPAEQSAEHGPRIVMAFHSTVQRARGHTGLESLRVRGPDGEAEVRATTLIRSTGHRGEPVSGLPFDEHHSTVPNEGGRVMDPATGQPVPGTYVVGWIKRGATGGIGTNRTCARETGRLLLADAQAGRLLAPAKTLRQFTALVRRKSPQWVSRRRMDAIDRAERQRGHTQGRPRVKFSTRAELITAARRR